MTRGSGPRAVVFPLLLLAALSGLARAEPVAIQAEPITLYPDDPGRRDAGQLTFLTGLRLTSPNRNFGGVSGLLVAPDGRGFIMLTDKGHLIRGRFELRAGLPAGVAAAGQTVLPGAGGLPQNPRYRDSEAITAATDKGLSGDLLIAFEGWHRVLRYPVGQDQALQPPTPVTAFQDLNKQPKNGGIEAMAWLSDQRLLALSEEALTDGGQGRGWLWAPGHPQAEPVMLARGNNFKPTDLAPLPDGGALLLERRLSLLGGWGMRIRWIKAGTIRPGAVLDGPELTRLSHGNGIDNMEGIAVTPDGDGFLIYVISDNNFDELLQKTVLMVFRWVPDGPAPPPARPSYRRLTPGP